MARVYFRAVPFDKSAVTLAIESGVDGIIAPAEQQELVKTLARCEVWSDDNMVYIALNSKSDEEEAATLLKNGERVALSHGWEVIPVENLLAQSENLLVEATTAEEAVLASGILEKGVAGVVIPESAAGELKNIVKSCKIRQGDEALQTARITAIRHVGLGHRVCLDTLAIMHSGQGMLVGNSSAFTFLVHAETEHNEYVASRPFRVNAGAVHAYIRLPHDCTTYLEELKPGDELLIVNSDGSSSIAILGRVKIEIRPMLLIEAEAVDANGEPRRGTTFLQNAETIRLTAPDGKPVSVVELKPGDEILCHLDDAGRHFGMRIKEEIREA